MKIIILNMVIFVLIGCGGGGGGSDGSSGTEPESSEDSTNILPPTSSPLTETVIEVSEVTYSASDAQTMAELSVPNGFNYSNSTQKNIQINLSQLVNSQAHVSVYSEYTLLDGGDYDPVQNSKVVSAPLVAGELNLSFSLNNSNDGFLVEIWVFGDNIPMQKTFNTQDSLIWYE